MRHGGLLCWFVQSGTAGARWQPLCDQLISRGLEKKELGMGVARRRRCRGWDTGSDWKGKGSTLPAALHVPLPGVGEPGRNSPPGRGSPPRIRRPLGSDDAWRLLGRERLDTAFSTPARPDSPYFGYKLQIVIPCVSYLFISELLLPFRQNLLDLKFAGSDPMRLVPVYFGFAYRTSVKRTDAIPLSFLQRPLPY